MRDELLTRTSLWVPSEGDHAAGTQPEDGASPEESPGDETNPQAVRPDEPLWWETRLGRLLPWRDDLQEELPDLPGESGSPAAGFYRHRDRTVWVDASPGGDWPRALEAVDGLCLSDGDGPILVKEAKASSVDDAGLRGMALLRMGAHVQRIRREVEQEETQELPEEKDVDRIGASEVVRDFARVPNHRARYPLLKSEAASFFHQSLRCMEDVVGSVREGSRVRAPVIRDCGRVVREALHLLVEDSHLAVNLVNVQSEADYLASFPLRVSVLAGALAIHMGHVKQSVMNLLLAALFQDLGMVSSTGDGVLSKEGPLTPEEWTFVHEHPQRSAEIIQKSTGIPQEVRLIALQSHERIDGSGYPSALLGERVHSLARILSAASAYVASITPRPYRVELSPFEGVLSVLRASAAGQVDPIVAEALLEVCSCFPIGSAVSLNTGEMAKVIGTNGPALGSPVLSVVCDAEGDRLFFPASCDPLTDPSVWIVDSVRASQTPSFDASYGF